MFYQPSEIPFVINIYNAKSDNDAQSSNKNNKEKAMKEKKSLGILKINKNRTMSKSPFLVGNVRLQRHHINAFLEEFEDADDTEVIAQLAAWRMSDDEGNPFLNVEIQPRWNKYSQQKQCEKKKEKSVFDFSDDDD